MNVLAHQVGSALCLLFDLVLALYPSLLLPHLPAVQFPALFSSYVSFIPRRMDHAFELGQLYQQYLLSSDAQTKSTILSTAARTLSIADLSESDFLSLKTLLPQLAERRGVLSMVIGFFTFVNIIWLVAIAGISVSVGPVLYHASAPLRRLFSNLLTRLLRVSLRFLRAYLLPVLRALTPLYILAAYALTRAAPALVAKSLPPSNDVALYLTLPSLIAFAALLYSAPTPPSLASATAYFATLFASASLNAIIFKSRLFAHAALYAFSAAFRFAAGAFGLAYVVGFNSLTDLRNSYFSSLLVICVAITARVAAPTSPLLPIFEGALSVWGPLVHFLALLIAAARYGPKPLLPFGATQALMVASLLVALLAGSVLHMEALTNVSIVFTVLYGVEKVVEVRRLWTGAALWFTIFFFSVGLYFSALWIHTHSNFLFVIFSGK
jgi:hypothetical protein